MSYDFQLGKTYTFNTKAPSILGVVIKNAKLTSILDYETARKYDEVDLKYRNVYPLLPSGTPDKIESCIFYKFKAENGSMVILADQWINETTIELIESINIKIMVTDISIKDISRIRDSLLVLGYQNISITEV